MVHKAISPSGARSHTKDFMAEGWLCELRYLQQ